MIYFHNKNWKSIFPPHYDTKNEFFSSPKNDIKVFSKVFTVIKWMDTWKWQSCTHHTHSDHSTISGLHIMLAMFLWQWHLVMITDIQPVTIFVSASLVTKHNYLYANEIYFFMLALYILQIHTLHPFLFSSLTQTFHLLLLFSSPVKKKKKKFLINGSSTH